jgi:hypothetical protein
VALKNFNANLTGYEQGAVAQTAEPLPLTISGILGSTLLQDTTNPRRSGRRSYKVQPSSGSAVTLEYAITSASQRVERLNFGFRIETAPAAGQVAVVGWFEQGSEDLELRIDSSRIPSLYIGSTLIATGSTAVALNTWHQVLMETSVDTAANAKDGSYCRIILDSDQSIIFEAVDMASRTTTLPTACGCGRRNTPVEGTPFVGRFTDIVNTDSTGSNAQTNSRPRGCVYVDWAKPTGAAVTNTGAIWTDGAGGTVAATSWDNAPPTGTAAGAAGTQNEHLGAGTATDDLEFDCGSYVTSGMASDDVYWGCVVFCRHGEYAGSGTKTGHVAGVNSNPNITAVTFNFGDDVGATNTDATGTPTWRTKASGVTETAVTVSSSPRVQVRRTSTGTPDVAVDQAGFMFVWEHRQPIIYDARAGDTASASLLLLTATTAIPLAAAQCVAAPANLVPFMPPSTVFSRLVHSLSNLAIYWRMGSVSKLIDQTINGRHGTEGGGITVGGASSLDSPSADTATNFDGTNDQCNSTYNPWTAAARRTLVVLISRDASADQDTIISDGGGTSHVIFRLDSGSGLIRWTPNWSVGGVTWAAAYPGNGQKALIALDHNEATNTAELYVNGVSQGVKTSVPAYGSTLGGVQLGAVGTATDPFDGQMDEFFVIEGGLTAQQHLDLWLAAAQPIPLAASQCVAAPSLTVSVVAAVTIPLDASQGVATGSLALTAPTTIPLAASQGVATGALALTAPTTIPLAAAQCAAAPSLTLTAPTKIPLQATQCVATASLALSAPTAYPFQAAQCVATASLAITAPTRVTLAASQCVATGVLAVTAPTTITLGVSSGVATSSLAVTAPTSVVLQPAACTATTSLVLAAFIPLQASVCTATAALAVNAPTAIALAASAAQATASLTFTAPTIVSLNAASGTATATLGLTAVTSITLQPAAGQSNGSLVLAAIIPLGSAGAVSVATLNLTAPTAILLAAATPVATSSMSLGNEAILHLQESEPSASATLALHAVSAVVLDTSFGQAGSSLALSVRVLLTPDASTPVADATLTLLAPAPLTGTTFGQSSATLDLRVPVLLVPAPSICTADAFLTLLTVVDAALDLEPAVCTATGGLTLFRRLHRIQPSDSLVERIHTVDGQGTAIVGDSHSPAVITTLTIKVGARTGHRKLLEIEVSDDV